jgi:hypothetical protein
LAVAVTPATPEPLVVAEGADKVALAPDPGVAKLTEIPLNGLPAESLTVACSAVANAVVTCVDCGVPAVASTVAGGPVVLVSEKVPLNPPTLAVTWYAPSELLAVAVTLATPDALVIAVGLDSVALAPLPGALKFTVMPLSGLPPASFTVA